ncbi:MAG: NAD(+) diphosphatase [Polyangiaceae bacterium]|nr:NAD(+) diphosphatase [Polyangiaceae bacterium]
MSYLFRSPDPAFVPSAAPLPEGADPLLLAFRGQNLVHRESGLLAPTVAEAAAAGLVVEEVLPLGTLEGRAIAFASLPADTKLPDGYAASSLRRLMFTLEGSLVGAAALASQLAAFEEITRFCGGCGGPLVRKAGERAKRCERDDRDIYPQVAPCVIVLIHDGSRVVLARAPRLPAGMYALVAGFVEPGETLEDCVHREVKEEVGLEVGDLRYVASQPWPFPSQLMVGFFARYRGGDIVPDPSEIDDAAWFDIADLPMIPPPFSVARFLIDEYMRLAPKKEG